MLQSQPLPVHNSSGLHNVEPRFPLCPHFHNEQPEQAASAVQRGTRSISFEDRQLLPQSGVFQRDLFVAGKDKKDEPQYSENRLEHDAVLCLHRCRKSIASFALRILAKDNIPLALNNPMQEGFTRSQTAAILNGDVEAALQCIDGEPC